MAIVPPLFLLFLFVFPSGLSSSLPDPSPPPPTVYDLLPKYGLPRGLLPDTVLSYSLSPGGSFSVQLSGPCYVQFESHLVYYHPTITGTLKIGGIHDLSGIEVRKLLIWLGVSEIKVDLPPSDYIYFEVGWITKKLPVDEFSTVQSCKDGKSVLESPEEIPMLLTE